MLHVDRTNGVGDGDLYDAGGTALSDQYAEQQLLGYMLVRPAAMTEVIEIIAERDLLNPFHRRIFNCLARAYETDHIVDATNMIAALGGDPAMVIFDGLTTSAYIAKLMVDADMSIEPAEIAEHLQQVSERRALGSADDVGFDPRTLISKFGGQRFGDISAAGQIGYSWLVEDIVPMDEISLIFGDSGSGKSFDAFDLSMAVARGLKWNGANVEPGLVVYIAAEAGKGFGKRKLAYTVHHKLAGDLDLPFYLMTKRPNFFASDGDVDAVITEIRAVVQTYGVPLVAIVLDTLSALAPGMNENASSDVSMVRLRLVRILEAFRVAVLLVHHKPKGGNTPRGHGSLTADFETTIEFETLTDKKTSTGKTIHRATVRKQREGKSGYSWEFTLPVVDVGRNKWGNVETSCVVAPLSSSRKGTGYRASANELLFMRALFEALDETGELPDAEWKLPRSVIKVVDLKHVRSRMREKVIDKDVEESVADNRFRVSFKRAGDAMRDGAIIGVHSGFVWYTGKPVQGLSTDIDEGDDDGR